MNFKKILFLGENIRLVTPTNKGIDLSDEEILFELNQKKKILDLLFKRENPEEDFESPFFE